MRIMVQVFHHLSKRVGSGGRVFANDIDDRALADLRDRVNQYKVSNIEVVLGRVDDPCLPMNALDMAIIVRTYHELAQPGVLLRKLKASLKPDAMLVIVGLDTEKERHNDAKSSTAEASIRNVARSAGYDVVAVHTFLPEDTIFMLRMAPKVSWGPLPRSRFIALPPPHACGDPEASSVCSAIKIGC
jgi:precorrin-6B methylase 2